MTSPYRCTRIYIPSTDPIFFLGLPGLVCTISGSRSGTTGTVPIEAEARLPVRVYGPRGIVDYLRTMLDVSNTFICMPLLVYELVDGPVTAEERRPQLVHARSKLFQCKLPSDAFLTAETNMNEDEENEMLIEASYSQRAKETFQELKEPKPAPNSLARTVFRPFTSSEDLRASNIAELERKGIVYDAAAHMWSLTIDNQWSMVATRTSQNNR